MVIKRTKKKGSTVYILCGLPGSGKSTWCKKYHPKLPIVSRDIIRAELGFTSGPDEKARKLARKESNKRRI